MTPHFTNENPPCSLCGGPHQFDTSIPSVLWNRVIRAKGLPEYLCTNCILREFARDGVSFSAELYGADLHGTPITIEVNGSASTAVLEINDENNRLRAALTLLRQARAGELREAWLAGYQAGECFNGDKEALRLYPDPPEGGK